MVLRPHKPRYLSLYLGVGGSYEPLLCASGVWSFMRLHFMAEDHLTEALCPAEAQHISVAEHRQEGWVMKAFCFAVVFLVTDIYFKVTRNPSGSFCITSLILWLASTYDMNPLPCTSGLFGSCYRWEVQDPDPE